MYRFSVLFVAIVFFGCATAAPYVQKGSTSYQFGYLFGYSDKKLAEGLYSVRFEGNDHNTMPEVAGYVKRRAAELCASSDFEAEIRQFHRMRTEASSDYPYFKGIMTHAPFPTAEAQVKCKARS